MITENLNGNRESEDYPIEKGYVAMETIISPFDPSKIDIRDQKLTIQRFNTFCHL